MEHLCGGHWSKIWSNIILLTTVLWLIFTCLIIFYSLTRLGQQAIWTLQESHNMWLAPAIVEISFLPRGRGRKREIHWALVELPLGWITNIWCNAPWLSPPAWEQFRLLFLPANSQSRHHTDIHELIPRERLWLRSDQCYRLNCSVSLLIMVNRWCWSELWNSNQVQIVIQMRYNSIYFFLTFPSQAI